MRYLIILESILIVYGILQKDNVHNSLSLSVSTCINSLKKPYIAYKRKSIYLQIGSESGSMGLLFCIPF
jgi:hypothetical protein